MSHGALKNLNVSGATCALSLAKIPSGTEIAAIESCPSPRLLSLVKTLSCLPQKIGKSTIWTTNSREEWGCSSSAARGKLPTSCMRAAHSLFRFVSGLFELLQDVLLFLILGRRSTAALKD
jgi:hypothetical protein